MQSNQTNNNATNNNSNASPAHRPLSLRTGADGRFHAATATANTATRIENPSAAVSKKGADDMDVEERPLPVRLGKPAAPPTSLAKSASPSPASQQQESVGQSLFNRTKKRERPAQSLGLSASGPLPHSTPPSLSGSMGAHHSSLGTSGAHGGGQTAFIEYFEPKKEAKPGMCEID